jgi:predicted transcriptional regulator
MAFLKFGTTMEKTVVSTQVDSSVRVRLEQLAVESDRTLSAEIRRAITGYLTAADRQQVEMTSTMTEAD